MKSPLRSDIQSFLDLGLPVLIAGDFNWGLTLIGIGSWNSVNVNPNGRALLDLGQYLNFNIVIPDTSTRFPPHVGQTHHTPEVLDIALLEKVSHDLLFIETYNALSSDHRPIIMKLGQNTGEIFQTKSVVDWHRLNVKTR